MREMKDSGIEWIGEIPKDWEVHPVYAYFEEGKTKNYRMQEQNLLSLSYGKIIRKDINTNGGLLPASFNTYNVIEAGDIIIRPTDLQNDKRSLRTGLVKEQGIITSAYIDLRPKDNVNSKYYHYLLHSYDIIKVFYNMGNGVRQGLNFSEFAKLLLLDPSKVQQQQIADFLDTKCSEIDATAEDIQKEISLLEDYKKSVITEAVTKGLNPDAEMKDSKIFYLGQINKTWNLTKVGYCCKKLYRPFEPSDEALVCSNKGKVVPRGDTLIGLMTSDDNAMQGICKGDIAIHGMDTWHGAIACSEYDGKITRVVHVCKADGDNRFVVYWLQHLAFVGVYKLISNGVRGNTSDFRSWDKVADIYVPNPIKEEQQQIADYLDSKCSEIDTLIADKKRQLDILADYKKSIIYEYVTGKKEVPVNE